MNDLLHTVIHSVLVVLVRSYVPPADGNEGLNDTSLPSFASYTNSSSAVITRHGNLSCPVISGQYTDGRSMRLSLDPSYLEYSHCVCTEGMEVTCKLLRRVGNWLWRQLVCAEGTKEIYIGRVCVSGQGWQGWQQLCVCAESTEVLY